MAKSFKFELSSKPKQLGTLDDVLNHEFSTNANKLVAAIAKHLQLDIKPIKEVKPTTKGEITIYRFSSEDCMKIWDVI